MHVLFLEPAFPRNQREHVRGLHAAGARVTAIGEAPFGAIDGELRQYLHAYEQVSSVVNVPDLERVVRGIQQREPVDRLEATVEAHIEGAAEVRERCGIQGTSTRTAYLCRDKPAMKEELREAGVPCANSVAAESAEEVRKFARQEGYPLILKPSAGAGASGTYRVTNDEELEHAIRETHVDQGARTAVEEFIEGHEAFYDTLSIEGRPVHDFVCHYFPGVLEAMRTRWISPQIVVSNRIDTAEHYAEVRELGRRVIDVLGIGTSATHMEWFFGDKGLKFSEIGCRPPGVSVWDLYSAANDLDIYEEWGKAIVQGTTDVRCSRNYSTGMIAIRPDRDGRITSYEGLEEIQQRFGDCILDVHAPAPGSPTQPVEGGYMANTWLRLRHPDYDELRRIMDTIGETVKVHAE
jgi:D-alanine-D-alanine ligase-like ATP-grasp enzyme